MKHLKTKTILTNSLPKDEIRLSVFAEPSARKSYQRLFEIAKMNFQSIDTPKHIAKLLWQG